MARVIELRSVNRLSITGFHADVDKQRITIDVVGQHVTDEVDAPLETVVAWPAVVLEQEDMQTLMALCGVNIVTLVMNGLMAGGALNQAQVTGFIGIMNMQPALMSAAFYQGMKDGLYAQL